MLVPIKKYDTVDMFALLILLTFRLELSLKYFCYFTFYVFWEKINSEMCDARSKNQCFTNLNHIKCVNINISEHFFEQMIIESSISETLK